MNRASPQMRGVAARLIADETRGGKSAATGPPRVFHVCEKLRPHLATLMGKAGFRAVLSRALAVVSGEVPWMRAILVNADGSLEGWDKAEVPVEAKQLEAGGVLLIAQLLGLLVAFIGENLTLRLVRDAWPKLSFDDLNFTKGTNL